MKTGLNSFSLALLASLGVLAVGLSGCDPEIGSPDWCADMKEKSVGDWTGNQTADYAKNCVL
ncbi:MAG: DUF3012 domain-containing protein [Alphaproteobacteria bacterium]|nr:DUF3012 domain-containing protein [Alphaproteobacteria bacterium]